MRHARTAVGVFAAVVQYHAHRLPDVIFIALSAAVLWMMLDQVGS